MSTQTLKIINIPTRSFTIVLTLILCVFSVSLQGQSYCSTTGGSSAIGPIGNPLAPPPPGPYYIKIYVYKVGDSNGQNLPTDDQVLESISILRSDFEEFKIFFVWDCNNIELILDSALDSLAQSPIPEGPRHDCFLAQYVTHTDGISVFIGGDQSYISSVATGIPGKALLVKGTLSYAGNDDVVASRSRAISHEMGHCLGLWHTHHGDEEGTDCDDNLVDPNECQECVNGSNGLTCGDYVADTPADPGMSQGIMYLNNCQYTQGGVDNCVSQTQYAPDPSLIMSYTHPLCMLAHTTGQGERMRMMISTSSLLQGCLVQPDYTDITINTNTPSGTSSFPSTTWDIVNTPNNGEVLVDFSLTIESGATLTINSGVVVRFGSQGKLIIKPNAKLVLHGTLTSQGCTQNWEGVQVWGSHFSKNQSQYSINGVYAQGILKGESGENYNALIENANTAVQLFGPSYLYSGGQLFCNGTIFKNNITGVTLAPFRNFYPYPVPPSYQNQPRPYRASFTNC